jgi:hypothetical protein
MDGIGIHYERLGPWPDTELSVHVDGAPDGPPLRGIEIAFDGTTVRARSRTDFYAEMEVKPNEEGKRLVYRIDSKTHQFEGLDGTLWTVFAVDCGCGG